MITRLRAALPAMLGATAIVAPLALASLLLRDSRSFGGGHPNLRTPASPM